jgi:hypothetical protein
MKRETQAQTINLASFLDTLPQKEENLLHKIAASSLQGNAATLAAAIRKGISPLARHERMKS